MVEKVKSIMPNNFIEEELYNKIRNLVPRCCVDLVIINEYKETLLGMREFEPCKGEYWILGGAIHHNETIDDAIKRKLYEEAGITSIEASNFIGVEEWCNDRLNFHDICLTYSIMTRKITLRSDSQHDYLRWFKNLPYINFRLKNIINKGLAVYEESINYCR
jgi:colanic acid biosynthesis protein WcaH